MNFIVQEYISSARTYRNTANYCRRVAIAEEASRHPSSAELARKWWDYYWEHRALAWGIIKRAKRERSAS